MFAVSRCLLTFLFFLETLMIKIYKWLMVALLATFFTQWAQADTDWIPQGKDRWYMRIEGVGGEADIYVHVTAKKKVMFRVVQPCPDMEPKRVKSIIWDAGAAEGSAVTCYKEHMQLPTPPLWEKLTGIPLGAQRYVIKNRKP